MDVQYVNGVLFYEPNTSFYYVITSVIGLILNHHLQQDECVYDFHYFDYYDDLKFQPTIK